MNSRIVIIMILVIFTKNIIAQYGIKELPIYEGYKLVKLEYENASGEKAITIFKYNDDFISKAIWQIDNESRSGTITYKYDEFGNIIEKNRVFSDSITINQSFVYDQNSNLIIDNFERSDGIIGKVEYSYDNNGKLLRAICNKQNGWFSGTITYEYNEKGSLIKGLLIQKDIVIGEISYTYDLKGLLIKEYWEFPGQWNQTFIYDYIQSETNDKNQLKNDSLIEIANSEQLWTGVAVSRKGRIFVNFPRWGAPIDMSVAEILDTGEFLPYPNSNWNDWSDGISPENHFYCVQSVYIDKNNYLWILDSGNPGLTGIVKNGPKLVKVNIQNNKLMKIYQLKESILNDGSYLNDIRVDTKNNFAFITDSGNGAIIVINLSNEQSRRILDNHYSTQAENIILNVEGMDLSIKIHSDGLALSPDNKYIYYQALSSRKLYRIKTDILRDFYSSEDRVESAVEYIYNAGVNDGITFDSNGYLYLTSIEKNAIRRWLPPDGDIQVLVSNPIIKWPDSISISPNSYLYFTTSQLHLGELHKEPFRLFKMEL